MSIVNSAAPRWAVSTRTHGEVLTAGASLPPLDIALLGVPAGFSPTEIDGWLRDLAGVASETARQDARIHAIPPLLHHALAGLLFSQAELWSRTASALPCAAVFVDAPEGAAFGWVGETKVQVRIEDQLYEPQWVRVRDDDGREAKAAVLPPGARMRLT